MFYLRFMGFLEFGNGLCWQEDKIQTLLNDIQI